MKPLNIRIWAGIVTYNPNLYRLKENIDSIYKQVSTIVIYDNGSNNFSEISTLTCYYREIVLIHSCENKGLAYALNQICSKAFDENVDWILLLDQDSVSQDKCIDVFSDYFELKQAAVLCPVMFDSRRRVNAPLRANGYTEVDECIQSGAIYNVKILKEVGFFDDWYFIDYIDYDYCITVRRKGYKIYQINSLILDQEASTIEPVFCHDILMKIAIITKLEFFAKLSYRPSIKPWRSYYTARNRTYYIYKNRDMLNVPKEKCCEIFSNIRNIIRIRNHRGTFKAICKGLRDGKIKIREMKKSK